MNYDSIQEELTELYQELNSAENDLYVSFNSSPLLDSGEENWVRDQERFINALRAKIQSLTTLI
jgi:superfamily I DNA/RNA helicase